MATKTALEQYNKQVRANNEAFEKLSPAKKRVAIARDVLAQIGSRLRVTQGTYLSSQQLIKARKSRGVTKSTQIQELFGKIETCNVCAKGALFICGIDKANKLKIADLETDATHHGQFYGTDVTNYLERFFDARQLELIESTFEITDMSKETLSRQSERDWEDEPSDDIADAIEFGNLFREDAYDEDSEVDTDALLRAIMENIIVNKGTFRPEILPVRRWVTTGFRG